MREPNGAVAENTIAKAANRFVMTMACAVMLLSPVGARAYYDKNDTVEPYFILPNESAFFIPDVGANAASETTFGSIAYLEENKIKAKRFTVPHTRLAGSSYFQDYYVPTGRLIIVDRSPYSRQWARPGSPGATGQNESFPCQSVEGLNVTVEVDIAASVTEEDAATYLYWSGIRPRQGSRSDPQVIFASVYSGRSLADVMDGVGRGKIQSLVCREIGARALDKVNTESNAMMDNIRKAAEPWFKSRGITIDYIGWGDFLLDPDVQKAINDRYAAEKIGPVLPILQAKALLDATQRWDGHLPTSVSGLWLVPDDLLSSVQGWLNGGAAKKP